MPVSDAHIFEKRHFQQVSRKITVKNIYYYYTGTVLPRLVRMHTINLMSFSGFNLTERAYYPRGRTIQLFTS